jgi:Domain of unknown function (DUF5062)
VDRAAGKAARSADNSSGLSSLRTAVKKLKHETELIHEAIIAGVHYAEARGAAVFEPTDSASDKILYIYRLLVHDKLIQPLPEDQVSQQSMRHKLAIWYSKQLPKDHPLLR